jgi:hypothetical protein
MEKKSFKQKWDNYWYYYKYHTLAGIFIIAVIVLIVMSCSNRDGEVSLVLVDTTALVNDTGMKKEIFPDYAEKNSIDTSGLLIRSQADYVDDATAERTGAKSLIGALECGEIDGIFVYRGIEMQYKYIGDIKAILPEDLIESLNDSFINYLETDQDELAESGIDTAQTIAGIKINDAKRFKETYGETQDIIVLQIPQNCANTENIISFIKYLFDI